MRTFGPHAIMAWSGPTCNMGVPLAGMREDCSKLEQKVRDYTIGFRIGRG